MSEKNASPIVIAPSILSADFGRLHDEVVAVAEAGADWIHVDVMDGRFVPNITIGPVVVEAVRRATSLPLDVHLMIQEPERYVAAFSGAGADRILVHVEGNPHVHRTLNEIRRLGCKAGIVLNPQTEESLVRYLLDDLDQILVMSVNPGFGGQAFIPSSVAKVRALRSMIDASKRDIVLEVDGGVASDNIGALFNAGATAFVAGSSVFGKRDIDLPASRMPKYRERIASLREAASK
jgi:ribulose-phosphate 3-epimerase